MSASTRAGPRTARNSAGSGQARHHAGSGAASCRWGRSVGCRPTLFPHCRCAMWKGGNSFQPQAVDRTGSWGVSSLDLLRDAGRTSFGARGRSSLWQASSYWFCCSESRLRQAISPATTSLAKGGPRRVAGANILSLSRIGLRPAHLPTPTRSPTSIGLRHLQLASSVKCWTAGKPGRAPAVPGDRACNQVSYSDHLLALQLLPFLV